MIMHDEVDIAVITTIVVAVTIVIPFQNYDYSTSIPSLLLRFISLYILYDNCIMYVIYIYMYIYIYIAYINRLGADDKKNIPKSIVESRSDRPPLGTVNRRSNTKASQHP